MRRFLNMKTLAVALATGTIAVGLGYVAQSSAVAAASAAAAVKIGEPAPDFTLVDLDGKSHKLSELKAQKKIIVLEWFNPQCPYVVKHHQTFKTMKETRAEFGDKVVWVAINSGAAGRQGTGKTLNADKKAEYGIEYPILLDESGIVGKQYGARTTPHMFVIDAEGILAYKGAIDNNRKAGELGDINYVQEAVKSLLAGETVTTPETRPYGCSVKYGN